MNAEVATYTFVKGAAEYGANATTPLVASIRQGDVSSSLGIWAFNFQAGISFDSPAMTFVTPSRFSWVRKSHAMPAAVASRPSSVL